VKRLGEPGEYIDYPHANVNFAGDCVYALQRHFADCMQSGAPFESSGEDYLKTLQVVEAVYESAQSGEVVRL
jgi:predicted dehydrogenase